MFDSVIALQYVSFVLFLSWWYSLYWNPYIILLIRNANYEKKMQHLAAAAAVAPHIWNPAVLLQPSCKGVCLYAAVHHSK